MDEGGDLRQTEAGAMSGLFRREERLKGPPPYIRRHAGAIIANLNDNIGVRRVPSLTRRVAIRRDRRAGSDRQPATVRHRVARVEDEIEDRILQPVRVDKHRRKRLRELSFECDPLTKSATQHITHAQDQLIDIGQLRFKRLTAGEGEQSVRQYCSTFGSAHRRPGKSAQSFFVFGQALFKRFDSTRDHGQQIIEVMCDSARELAKGVHLLGVTKLCLGFDPAGDFGF